MLTPAQRIFAGAFIGGFIGLFGGVGLALLLHPESNLGPLLGILVTGPFGAIVGALFTDRENQILIVLWILTLLATSLFTLAPKMMLPAIVVQLLFVAAAFRFRSGYRWILAAVFALAAIASAFPPIADATGHTAGFASIFDSRLDASKHVPDSTVLRWLLILEWAAAAAIALPITKAAAEAAANSST